MGLITVVSTVVVTVTGPVFWYAAATVTFELDTGAGVTAAGFITVVSTVVVCLLAQTHTHTESAAAPRTVTDVSVTGAHRCHSAS